jgi:hypothetical protein
MKRRSLYVASILVGVGAAGCAQSGDGANRDPRGPERQMVVELGEKTLASPQPAVMNVAFAEPGRDGQVELSWDVGGDNSLVVRAPYAIVRTGRFEAELVNGPLNDTGASANLRIDGRLVGGGKVSVELAKGRLIGRAELEDLSFNGVLAVSCSVTQALLKSGAPKAVEEPAHGTASEEARPAGAPIPDDVRAAPVLIDDLRFQSRECARVKAELP